MLESLSDLVLQFVVYILLGIAAIVVAVYNIFTYIYIWIDIGTYLSRADIDEEEYND